MCAKKLANLCVTLEVGTAFYHASVDVVIIYSFRHRAGEKVRSNNTCWGKLCNNSLFEITESQHF